MSEIGTENNDKLRMKKIEKIIIKYSNMIFRLAYQYLQNYHDAEDILQDVAITLVTGNSPIDDERHLKNWLAAVTLNKCRNLKKSAWKRKVEPINEDIAIEVEEAFEVLEELNKLNENQRNVLYLYYYESFTIDEIAEILNRSRNTVASWFRRGKSNLRKILEKGGYNDV